ncbi:hypothetical protein BH11PLA2_BH11PLA2_52850 [soil metagenome]
MNPTATLHLSTTNMRLSDTLTATLTIEGPAPLAVTLPKPLLNKVSSLAWTVTPSGPTTVLKLLDGHERWTQQYRLDPYAVNDSVPVTFSPIVVASGTETTTITLPTQNVKVTTEIRDEASATLRPLMGPEPLPAVKSDDPQQAIVSGLLALAVVLSAVTWVRFRRKPVVITPPSAIALSRLAALEEDIATHAFAHRLSDLIRSYFEAETGVLWTKLTTAELLGKETAMPWLAILERCDAERFAGNSSDTGTRLALIREVRHCIEAMRAQMPLPKTA